MVVGDLLSATQESAGAESALFMPPSPETGLRLGGEVCLVEAGEAEVSRGDASPCSRHPFTSSTGMSAAELRMEGGQLLACPFWDRLALVLVEQAALGWWEARVKGSPEGDLMPGEGGWGLPMEPAGDGQAASESSLWSEWVLLQGGDRVKAIRGGLLGWGAMHGAAQRPHASPAGCQLPPRGGKRSQETGLGYQPRAPSTPITSPGQGHEAALTSQRRSWCPSWGSWRAARPRWSSAEPSPRARASASCQSPARCRVRRGRRRCCPAGRPRSAGARRCSRRLCCSSGSQPSPGGATWGSRALLGWRKLRCRLCSCLWVPLLGVGSRGSEGTWRRGWRSPAAPRYTWLWLASSRCT